ncbi:MAG: hypothetical protein LC776_12385 [Acidobacteria bacterium]|nr:hypothetical protein [Acidobacteriota bacterium]
MRKAKDTTWKFCWVVKETVRALDDKFFDEPDNREAKNRDETPLQNFSTIQEQPRLHEKETYCD